MLPNRETLLCRYHYSPLDQLVNCTPSAQSTTQRFYQKDRLATEIQGAVQHLIMQHGDQLLAQQQRQSGTVETRLLATDQQRSVLNVLDATRPNPLAYTPYGHRPVGNGLLSLLGFDGERPDPVTGHYHLGNGYRPFNPVLMCFTSPDSWSPFGEGGLNAYAYCGGDPVNRVDPTGHVNWFVKLFQRIGSRTQRTSSTQTTNRAANSPNVAPGSNRVQNNSRPGQTPSNNPASPVNRSPEAERQAAITKLVSHEIKRLETDYLREQSTFERFQSEGRPITNQRLASYTNHFDKTQQQIDLLRSKLPPPAYDKTLEAAGSDGLPTYVWALRNS